MVQVQLQLRVCLRRGIATGSFLPPMGALHSKRCSVVEASERQAQTLTVGKC